MTDHVPNDLSHLSNAEFHSLCPQGEHAPGPEPFSPAAQAVLDAANYVYDRAGTTGHGLAAALRVAADQVVPEELLKGSDPDAWLRDEIRQQLLAIADELEEQ
jgi:hypothetical protein